MACPLCSTKMTDHFYYYLGVPTQSVHDTELLYEDTLKLSVCVLELKWGTPRALHVLNHLYE